MRLLIVEDDKKVADFLKISLEAEFFAVDVVSDGEKGIYMAATNDYDLILLDRMLPIKNGAEVCVAIKDKKPQSRIIIVSAIDGAIEKADLLNSGADDYLVKPFSFTELLARIRAVIRRSDVLTDSHLIFDGVDIDIGNHRITVDDEEVFLTRKEFMLLKYLCLKSGKIVTRADIMEHVWDAEADPFSNSIETHISNIRKKVAPCRTALKTLSGVGYRLDVNRKS